MSVVDPARLQSLWTFAAFAVFVGIVVWAWSRKARRGFEEAERMPFADEPGTGKPDEGGQ